MNQEKRSAECFKRGLEELCLKLKNPDDLQSVVIIRIFSMHDNSHATMEISKKSLFSCIKIEKSRTKSVASDCICPALCLIQAGNEAFFSQSLF